MRVLLLLTALFTFSVSAAPTAIYNANGYHLRQGQLESFSVLVFENNKVLATGDQSLLETYPNAKRIDISGKTLLPGLIDAHGHVLGLGEALLKIDLRGLTSEQQSADKVTQLLNNNPNADWITGRGWNQVLWPGKSFPTKQSLDAVSVDRPVVFERVDGHALWVNSKALQLAGIDRNSIDPSGGEIIRDAKGEPTGVLIDTAMDLVFNVMPELDDSLRQQQLNAATQRLLSVGLTSTHDAGIDYANYQFYKKVADSLPIRIYAMVSSFDPQLQTMLDNGYISLADDRLSIRSVKGFGDGALGSRGAALKQEYSDDPGNFGILVTSEDVLPTLFKQVLTAGFQLNFHAIGDRANKVMLDNYANAYNLVGGKHLRHRIEHAQIVSPEDIPLFKQLDLIASMQPVHATSDMNMAEDRLGKARLKGAYAWQTFLNQGTVVAAGSDFPVELANPFHGLHAAITRQNHQNSPEDGWLPEEKLSRIQAFDAFTLSAAYAAHQEKIIGNLEAGKYADFIIVDQDIFNIEVNKIWQTKVLETWVAGQRRYQVD